MNNFSTSKSNDTTTTNNSANGHQGVDPKVPVQQAGAAAAAGGPLPGGSKTPKARADVQVGRGDASVTEKQATPDAPNVQGRTGIGDSAGGSTIQGVTESKSQGVAGPQKADYFRHSLQGVRQGSVEALTRALDPDLLPEIRESISTGLWVVGARPSVRAGTGRPLTPNPTAVNNQYSVTSMFGDESLKLCSKTSGVAQQPKTKVATSTRTLISTRNSWESSSTPAQPERGPRSNTSSQPSSEALSQPAREAGSLSETVDFDFRSFKQRYRRNYPTGQGNTCGETRLMPLSQFMTTSTLISQRLGFQP